MNLGFSIKFVKIYYMFIQIPCSYTADHILYELNALGFSFVEVYTILVCSQAGMNETTRQYWCARPLVF